MTEIQIDHVKPNSHGGNTISGTKGSKWQRAQVGNTRELGPIRPTEKTNNGASGEKLGTKSP